MFKVGESNKEIQQEHLAAVSAHFAWRRAPRAHAPPPPCSLASLPNSLLLCTHPLRETRHPTSYLKYPKFCLYKYGERNGT